MTVSEREKGEKMTLIGEGDKMWIGFLWLIELSNKKDFKGRF